jgi:hypothetical protein
MRRSSSVPKHGGRRPAPELARAYLKHHRTQDEADFWAFDEVADRVTYGEDPHRAWELVLALVEAAEDTNLGYVGAGPLEDLVTRFGPQLIAEIESQARRDPKFRACLGTIWLSKGNLPADILSRVVVASNGQIVPL